MKNTDHMSRNPLRKRLIPYLETPCCLAWCSTTISVVRYPSMDASDGTILCISPYMGRSLTTSLR